MSKWFLVFVIMMSIVVSGYGLINTVSEQSTSNMNAANADVEYEVQR